MADSGITKKALAMAMKQLMERQPFSKISVGDICELCDMNRKSFYYHFKDKYDLVNWIYYTEFITTARTRAYESGWDLFEALCEYFYENKGFYSNALEITGQNSFSEYFSSILQPVFVSYLSETFEESKNRDFFAGFFSDAFVISISKWLKGEPNLGPHEFIQLVKTAFTGAARVLVRSADRTAEEEKKE